MGTGASRMKPLIAAVMIFAASRAAADCVTEVRKVSCDWTPITEIAERLGAWCGWRFVIQDAKRPELHGRMYRFTATLRRTPESAEYIFMCYLGFVVVKREDGITFLAMRPAGEVPPSACVDGRAFEFEAASK